MWKKSIDYWYPILAGGVMGVLLGDTLFESELIGAMWGMAIGLAFIPSIKPKSKKREDEEEEEKRIL
ncbi:hypothetical protein [Bacillus toyonensis]|uniref:hypothetical protein n=1 Tax=Bacillus toyonensis TaxID=155322 RepID=UPI000BF641A6|nr:hypothetical protein [Bacillus toyonensis]PGF05210.1 hypothetical protein COM61_01970 [Bacillus toyonensis]